MDTLATFFKKVHFGKVFAAFVVSSLLLLNVACSSGSTTGARPNNPPVQMGGQNNPHKAGGDGNNDYQMSTDPAVTKRDRASAPALGQLIAAAKTERSVSDRQAQSANAPTRSSGNAMRDTLKEAKQIPEQPQEVIDRSDPNVRILEKSGNTFKEAAKHLTGDTEQSIERSGVAQQNSKR